jgi:hypothetical protein
MKNYTSGIVIVNFIFIASQTQVLCNAYTFIAAMIQIVVTNAFQYTVTRIYSYLFLLKYITAVLLNLLQVANLHII